ncbi:DoxX family protein [Sphaerimonospora sp. CA-214678]|uniref:DoxX family protein n=1 Tax=Sphaerimonospora sp. CA-214678 TaxID=3240029 RepID=UPI003D91EC59
MVQLASGSRVSDRSRSVHLVLSWVTTAARLVLGGVLLVAGALKVGAPATSVQAVRAYELLPESLVQIVGYGLPVVEIVIGALLVVGLLTRVSGVISGLVMAAFVVGIASAWARGLRIDCGCFGGGGQLADGQDPNYLWELLRDFGLLACAAWIVARPPGRLALDSVLGLSGSPKPDAEDDGPDGAGDPSSENGSQGETS